MKRWVREFSIRLDSLERVNITGCEMKALERLRAISMGEQK